MFIDRQEPAMPAISAHKKPVDHELQAAIAKFEEEVGVTDLDDPNAPKRKTPRTDAELRALEGIEHKKAERKAQAEHQAALARLADGTAVHRQVSERPIVTKKAVKAKTKVVKPVATKASNTSCYVKRPMNAKTLAILARRSTLTQALKNGEIVESINWVEDLSAHQQQSYDLVQIAKKEQISIYRISPLKGSGAGYIVDKFERCDIKEPISCSLVSSDRKELYRALISGKMITIEQIKESTKRASATMATLARKYDFDIRSLCSSGKLVGWVLLEQSRLQEISKLVDALDALKYLAMQQKLKAYRFPMSVPDVILDAAFREYKRVQKIGQ